MLTTITIAYCIYFLVNFYTSFMQIDYIQKAKKQDAVILTPSKYTIAANYAVSKQKISLISSLYDFVLFFIWIGFGLQFLDSLTSDLTSWQKTVVVVDLFIIINWVLALPIDLYIFKYYTIFIYKRYY